MPRRRGTLGRKEGMSGIFDGLSPSCTRGFAYAFHGLRLVEFQFVSLPWGLSLFKARWVNVVLNLPFVQFALHLYGLSLPASDIDTIVFGSNPTLNHSQTVPSPTGTIPGSTSLTYR